jgi:GNAT superfamily N-acetyltransferase
MEIRTATASDLDLLSEIDGTIDSRSYLHVDRAGEGMTIGWKLQERPLRERLVRSNTLDDTRRFAARQILTGADDGVAMLAEHDAMPVALALAMPDPSRGVLQLIDLRVDFDHRRQGLATALLYAVITEARNREMRAVAAETTTDNFPACSLLLRGGFDLTGLDERRLTNHDLVKEAVTLFWYASLD